jgi:hypothetical protein
MPRTNGEMMIKEHFRYPGPVSNFSTGVKFVP